MTAQAQPQAHPSTFWHRFFGVGPSKELEDVRSSTNGMRHSARLLTIRASELSRKAQEIAYVADMLSGREPE